jgi:uncharacterized membrane protein
MAELTIIWDWLSLAVRWLHVITAIAWIGSSFYFVALDLGLRKAANLPAGAHGEEWQVHGGGFYHIRKYLVAPAELPEHLTWFKWESYATWLSGFALLCVMYYGGAHIYLVDTHVLDITATGAILLSLASIGIGWVVYDLLCKSPVGKNQNMLMVLLYVVLVAMAWGYTQVFSGRAAFLHLGAFTATIMSANVFLLIIPNQKKVVASLQRGQTPDPARGLPHAVEPLSAGLRHPALLVDCLTGVPDGRLNPPFLQQPARPQGRPLVDLGRNRSPLRHHHLAFDQSKGSGPKHRTTLHAPADAAFHEHRRL